MSISAENPKEAKSSDSSEEDLAADASQNKKTKVKKGRNYIPKRPPNLALKHLRAQRRANPTQESQYNYNREYYCNERDGLTPEQQFYADEFIQQTEQMSFGQQRALPFSAEQVYLNSPVPLFPEAPAFDAGPMSRMPVYGDNSSPIFIPPPSMFGGPVGPLYCDPTVPLGAIPELLQICQRFFIAHPNMTVKQFERLAGIQSRFFEMPEKSKEILKLKEIFEILEVACRK